MSDGTIPAPTARSELHRRLETYAAEHDWLRALDVLGQLADQEPVAERRARIHYAAAMIARDELADGPRAIDLLGAALDADPRTPGGFDALDALWMELGDRGDRRQRAVGYHRQIERLGDAAPAAELGMLWHQLGDLCFELADSEAAIAAYQVAAELLPDDVARREQLAELYLAGGQPRRRDAIAELQRLLARAPDRIELYKTLAGLYRAEDELDKAWCVAQVLVVLGAASDDERALYTRYSPARFDPPSRRLTDDLWHRAIAHPREDRRVGAIFAAVLSTIAADTAQPIAAFGLSPDACVDLEREPSTIGRILRQVCSVLAIEPVPPVWFDRAAAGLRIANVMVTAGGGSRDGVAGGAGVVPRGGARARLQPAVIVGMPQLASTAERDLAFEIGKRLTYLRPERFAALAVATLPRLEVALAAALRAAEPGRVDPPGGQPDDIARLAAQLRRQVPGPVLEQIGELAKGLPADLGRGDEAGSSRRALVAAWRAATDLTANRVGLVVAGDLETAARAIATEGATLSGLTVKDRLRDLLGYAASEPYFAVRRHLGQPIEGAQPRWPTTPRGAPDDAPPGEP